MLYYMARGLSGRIVLEVDPSLKAELYEVLLKEERTLKGWFVEQAGNYIEGQTEMPLFEDKMVAQSQNTYGSENKKALQQ